MMAIGGMAHLLMVLVSFIVGVLLFFLVKYSNEKVQNSIIFALSVFCMMGIFFLHGTKYGTTLDLKNLLIQMFQVCNFNLILLPLCLFKRNELARQYLFLFSMPMALSTFVSYPGDVSGSMWYSIVCLTFWCNHFLIVMIPILMVATKKFKPQKQYLSKVIVCIFTYFLISFVVNYILNGFHLYGNHNHSYTMDPGGIMILKPIYDIISIPFVYLWPVLIILILLYSAVIKIFEKYKVKDNFGIEI